MLFPELGRAGDIAQPGGFRREHILRLAPNPAAEQPLLSTLLDPRLLRYFCKTELESDLEMVVLFDEDGLGMAQKDGF